MRTIVIPIVVGALGVVSTAFKHRLKLPNWILLLLQNSGVARRKARGMGGEATSPMELWHLHKN